VPLALRGPLGIRVEPSTDKGRALAARAGKVQVPCLADSNTAGELFESKAIVRYPRRDVSRLTARSAHPGALLCVELPGRHPGRAGFTPARSQGSKTAKP
jgi:hypothetical protein